ncbi:YqhA family protein [Campylobacter sp. faydin G-24]|uniref:YqhA family protein n=1 Tax=Campylobacter anatolicus TaxID=2829105 RepID=A0ABS5HJU7_9BACT|nr:YqhA family protein [Campylobacter anatolicus]MBR8461944.1 YqhA family protein [Campylobacter anatolicus]MBR8464341.1 YqhA family protein [Campylobacter anatolicus]MBR8464966.1 YqhA family protein [Campylobacter anatolicus]
MPSKIFEKILLSSNIFTILPVIFGLLGAVVLFIIASYDVAAVMGDVYDYFFKGVHPENFHSDVVGEIVGAIDLYLMALVLYIFSFGIYELFISEIDTLKESRNTNVLEVHSLDELKSKIGNVIIMVLIVNFFQRVLHANFTTPLEMAYLAVSILALCLGLYFLHKGGH